MKSINPWINFNGNAEEAFSFYRSVFGGEFTGMIRFKEIAGPNVHVTEEEGNKFLRIMLPIGANTMLIGNDVPSMMGQVSERENRSKIFVEAESKEEAERIFNGLSVGGEVEFPMGESPWGAYYGSFRDKYGIEWMINFEQK